MAKTKTQFFCQSCGAQAPQWTGQCRSCGEWNTIVEERVVPAMQKSANNVRQGAKPQPLADVAIVAENRMPLPDGELSRVLGGGLVPGSVMLLGGEPGIGKSTLLLQLALKTSLKTLYVSGEESASQIKMRADRIGSEKNNCLIMTANQVEAVLDAMETEEPGLVIIDSIQTLQSGEVASGAGSVSQIRECAALIINFAKTHNIPVFLIGHINKEGQIAGPKILEHMVDVVLQFEGDQNHLFRMLRAHKNRFGSTHELGIYEMQGVGLREVENPSEILISKKDEALSGIAIAVTMEGQRPLLVEVQSLVSTAVYGTPQRSCTGYDTKRLNMLLAVLEKRCGFRLSAKDVFLNITGGIRVDDPAADLAIAAAILSSNEDQPLPEHFCFAGEVGLTGEVRPVTRVEQRIHEARKLGFKAIFVSRYNRLEPADFPGIQLITIGKMEELYRSLFA
jgi:DNA repair protein RadA/Sms